MPRFTPSPDTGASCSQRTPLARRWAKLLAASCLGWMALLAAQPARALLIEFDYTYDTRGFFTDQASGAPLADRRAILSEAAEFYAGFSDALLPISAAAGDQWSVRFMHPSLGGPQLTLNNLDIAANTVRIYVGGSPSAPGVLGMAGSGVVSVSGSHEFVETVQSRGQGNVSGAGATDHSTWGGYIWFNAAHDWYFGSDASGLTAGRPDFLTTAIHEIGHVLGFGSADSWRAQIGADGLFRGERAMAVHGGAVPLDPHGAHWGEGVHAFVNGVWQETLMDPSTTVGQRELPTELDWAGFADMGWQVSPVPEPSIASMLAIAALSLGLRLKRRRLA